MDQDGTWHGGGPWSRPHCARWGPSSPSLKGGRAPPIFGPCLLWPNGWIDQDATWYKGRPQPKRLCVRWGPSSPSQKGAEPSNFRPMSIVAGWIKMPLGTEVSLGSGHNVLDEDPAPPRKGHSSSPSFRPMSIVAPVAHFSYYSALVNYRLTR